MAWSQGPGRPDPLRSPRPCSRGARVGGSTRRRAETLRLARVQQGGLRGRKERMLQDWMRFVGWAPDHEPADPGAPQGWSSAHSVMWSLIEGLFALIDAMRSTSLMSAIPCDCPSVICFGP
eukprot:11841126-Alexandrium_andersonii.AAC.1